jgi:hypothetical protein
VTVVVKDAVVTAVAEIVGLSDDQVRQVFAAFRMVQEGAAVGTIAKDPETGAVAVRVTENGLPVWKVNTVSGDEWKDAQPHLDGWEILFQPE